MNVISKELRHQIAQKVSNALIQKNDDYLEKSKLLYKGRITKIVNLYAQYKQERDSLEVELQRKNFDIYHDERSNILEIQPVHNRIDQDEIVSKIVVQLQYSKEPDFLKSIDVLIQKEIPQKIVM